ncbi:MAG: hypothetical protein AB7I38_15360 [Dehalococcoidia bacterium]
MLLQPSARRVVTTRSGQYAVAVIPLWHSPLPGFHATAVQAVRTDGSAHTVRLTVYERIGPVTGPRHGSHAA